jgi:hypothetical protein
VLRVLPCFLRLLLTVHPARAPFYLRPAACPPFPHATTSSSYLSRKQQKNAGSFVGVSEVSAPCAIVGSRGPQLPPDLTSLPILAPVAVTMLTDHSQVHNPVHFHHHNSRSPLQVLWRYTSRLLQKLYPRRSNSRRHNQQR